MCLSKLIRIASKFDDRRFLEHPPRPGHGTPKERLKEFGDYGIKAKTDSLSEAASLSGYIKKLKITFNIVLNNSDKKGKAAQDVLDEILVENVRKIERAAH